MKYPTDKDIIIGFLVVCGIGSLLGLVLVVMSFQFDKVTVWSTSSCMFSVIILIWILSYTHTQELFEEKTDKIKAENKRGL